MKRSNTDKIIMAIFGSITCFISAGITMYYIRNSPLSIAMYLFYLLLSSVFIAECIRKTTSTNKKALICSVINAVLACISLELIYRILFDSDITPDIACFAAVNIASSFFLSLFFIFLLNHLETTNIYTIKNNTQTIVYEQINAEYIRLVNIINHLNSYSRLSQIEIRRYDYISLFPGVNKVTCDDARANAVSSLLKCIPKEEEIQMNTIGLSEYYKLIHCKLAYVRKSKYDFDQINSKREYKMFLDKYKSFIKV